MSFKFGVGRASRRDVPYSTAQLVNALLRLRELLLNRDGARADGETAVAAAALTPGPLSSERPHMPQRHPLLYDVERWRQWRFRLLGLAVVCFLPAILAGVNPTQAKNVSSISQIYELLAAFLLALALMFYLRARSSWMQVDGDDLVVKIAVSGRQRIPLAEVRKARLGKLRSVFDKPEMKRLRPRPYPKWQDRDALMLRIDSEAVDLVKLRRLLGARAVLGRDVVVPVADGAGLLREIERIVAPSRQAAAAGEGASRGAARRRKRR